MTIEMCQNFCATNNYQFAGIEYGTECYCDAALGAGSTLGSTGCTTVCPGNPTETCGSAYRLSVYKNVNYVAPQFVPSVGAYKQVGCYVDSTTARILPASMWMTSSGMTVENCIANCQSKGYKLAGVEYGGECYCDNQVAATARTAPLNDCAAKVCTGNKMEYCGGSVRILVYGR
jgi:hypothetical protein